MVTQIVQSGRDFPLVTTELRLAWALTSIVVGVDAIWLFLGGWTVAWIDIAAIAGAVAITCSLLMIERYRNDQLIRKTAEATTLLIVFMAAAASFSYLVVSTDAPLVDAQLAGWDRAIGFDWLDARALLEHAPTVKKALYLAYHSGLLQIAFVVVFLGFSARAAQLAQFMHLFVIVTILTILVSGLFPAAGAWKHYGVGGAFDMTMLSHFEGLREGHLREIALGKMQGLIAMPSLHAAIAVLVVYALRGCRFVLPLFALINAAMLASTPIDGGHYLVDVIAGVALAVGLIAFDRRRATHPRVMQTARHSTSQGILRR